MSNTSLILAAARGDSQEVTRHISQRGLRDKDGRTALMHAAEAGRAECVRLLMSSEAGMTTPEGVAARMLAAVRGHREVVRLLSPYEIQMRDSVGRSACDYALEGRHLDLAIELRDEYDWEATGRTTILMLAAATGNAGLVDFYICEAEKKDSQGMTALMHAARGGFGRCVRLLRDKEVLAQDKQGRSALMYAILNDHEDAAKLLLQELDLRDNQGKTAFVLGAEADHDNLVERLLLYMAHDNETPMTTSARIGYDRYVRASLGHELHLSNLSSYTTLMLAAMNGRDDLIPFYISQAARRTKDGMTALMLAAQQGHISSVKFAMREGASDASHTTSDLIGVANKRYANLIHLLAPSEAKLRDGKGRSASMHAAIAGNRGFLDAIGSTELHLRDDRGATALMYAAYYNEQSCAEALEAEASASTKDAWNGYPAGVTALMIASNRKYMEIVQLLETKEMNLKDSQGHDALWYATTNVDVLPTQSQPATLQNAPRAPSRSPVTQIANLSLERFVSPADSELDTECSFLVFNPHKEDMCADTVRSRLEEPLADAEALSKLFAAIDRGDIDELKKYANLASRKNDEGITALMYAVYGQKTSMVDALLAGAGVSTDRAWHEFPSKTTALMIAATRGSEDIVQILVPHEAGRVNANGHAAVYLAVAEGHERCSRLLYSEASVTDSNGATQLQLMRRLVGLS